MEQELCPICIEKPAEYFTECSHSFCIECLCKIKKCAMCRKSLLRSELCIEIKQKIELIDNPFENLVQTRIPINRNVRNINVRNRTNLMSTLYRINNPNPTTTFISNLIDSVHYNNNEEEYDEFGRRINDPEEYNPNPIISYYEQFPSRIPRWGDDNMWQQTRNIYPQNRIPRWGD